MGQSESGRPWGKVDSRGGKWTAQLNERGRSKRSKVDGLGGRCTVQNDRKWTVYESVLSTSREWTVYESGRSKTTESGQSKVTESGRSRKLKVDGLKRLKVDGLKSQILWDN